MFGWEKFTAPQPVAENEPVSPDQLSAAEQQIIADVLAELKGDPQLISKELETAATPHKVLSTAEVEAARDGAVNPHGFTPLE